MSSISHIALVDCNNFFVSCERLFRPELTRRPVIVLSSNDGCVVSRSNEAKRLGIGMGVPYFKVRDICRTHDVIAFSSNFALYRDISRRVMHTLRRFSDNVEVYSIDEAFLDVGTKALCPEFLAARAAEVRTAVLREVGIPVSVGVARTKTLAKIATHLVKEFQKELERGVPLSSARSAVGHPCVSASGTCVLLERQKVRDALWATPIEEVWGVGFRRAPQLRAAGIDTAGALVQQPDHWVRTHMSICGLRTVQELRGIRCFPVGEDASMRKSLLHSQSFRTPLRTQDDVAAAVVFHARKVAEILRAEDAVAREILVTVRTSRHRSTGRYAASDVEILWAHTNDTITIVRAARSVLARIFRPGVVYAKAGVMVRDIVPANASPRRTLFGNDMDARASLMSSLDDLRDRFGDTVRMGSECRVRGWTARAALLSPCYTSAWSDICRVPLSASTSVSTSLSPSKYPRG